MKSFLFKKLFPLLLAAVALLTLPLSAFAQDKEPVRQYENGYEFTIEETENGPVLRDVSYTGRVGENSETAFLPETLGGLPVTPEAINGNTFTDAYRCRTVKVSPANPYFKIVDGALYSKDGKALVYLPNREDEAIIRVPDGVETISEGALFYVPCVVLPDSVKSIGNEDGGMLGLVIAANTGTAAQAVAEDNGCKFVPLNEAHAHIWFRGDTLTEATCAKGALVELLCPCGATMQTETEPDKHRIEWRYHQETGDYTVYCLYCGKTVEELFGESYDPDDTFGEECSCVCHQIGQSPIGSPAGGGAVSFLRDFFYRLRILIWRLTGTHQYCECGARHY